MQIAMGMFVNYFFAGFILGKVPFQLSPSFRPMLQVPPAPPPSGPRSLHVSQFRRMNLMMQQSFCRHCMTNLHEI